MESEKKILKASAVIGLSSIIVVIIGLLKNKFLAINLGLEGIGQLGIVTSAMTFGVTIFGLGIISSGVRLIAKNIGDAFGLKSIKSCIYLASIFLAIIAYIIITKNKFFLMEKLSLRNQYDIEILGLGVAFGILSNANLAIIQGERKLNNLAKSKIIASIISAIVGILLVTIYGEGVIIWFVVSLPISTFFITLLYLKSGSILNATYKKVKYRDFKDLLVFGSVFMFTQAMTVGSQVVTRYIIGANLSLEDVGYFQASWQISMTYIAFILSALATDYYPRLSEIASEKINIKKMINEQFFIVIIISFPLLSFFISYSSFIIGALYSEDFLLSADILKYQIYGDLFKLFVWPLSFLILAKGDKITFFLVELFWNLIYILFIYLTINEIGVLTTGVSYLLSFFLYFIIVLYICSSRYKINYEASNKKIIVSTTILLGTLLFITHFSSLLSMLIGFVYTILGGGYFIIYVLTLQESDNKIINKVKAYLIKFKLLNKIKARK